MNTEPRDLDVQDLDIISGGVAPRPDGGGCTDPIGSDPLPLMPDTLSANGG